MPPPRQRFCQWCLTVIGARVKWGGKPPTNYTGGTSKPRIRLSRDEWATRLWHLVARHDVHPDDADRTLRHYYKLHTKPDRRRSENEAQRAKPRLTPTQADQLMRNLIRGTAAVDVQKSIRNQQPAHRRRRRALTYAQALNHLLLNYSVRGSWDDIAAWYDDLGNARYVQQAKRYNDRDQTP